MFRNILFALCFVLPLSLFGEDDDFDTLSIKPIGVDYSIYPGIDKLYIVGECEGMEGNQIVVFQNRPSFDFFEDNETYEAEQKELEKAIWEVIHDKDAEPIELKGVWHQYNERMVFLCHQILKLNNIPQLDQ
jgi:hypothetical protein